MKGMRDSGAHGMEYEGSFDLGEGWFGKGFVLAGIESHSQLASCEGLAWPAS